MNSNFIIINGRHPYLDYEDLERSFNETIGRNCRDCKVFVINNLPVSVSSEVDIDVIIVITVLNRDGNYFIVKNIGGRNIYLKNQIIPITFIKGFENRHITFEDNVLLCDSTQELDFSSELNSVRFGLRTCLENYSNSEKEKLYVNPLIYIKNQSNIYKDGYVVSDVFNFHSLLNYFNESSLDIFIANKDWSNNEAYYNIEHILQKILEQASIESETGFLTKQKLERIAKKLSSTRTIFNELGEQMVMISGKAGTGKSSELLLLTMKCIENGKNIIYLTYNRLLVYDISKTIKDYRNQLLNDSKQQNLEGSLNISTVDTLHSYFYKLSKGLGILHVLSESRINQVLSLLKTRLNSIYSIIKPYYLHQSNTYVQLKVVIKNDLSIDIPTKQEGIDFINYLINKRISRSGSLSDSIKVFYKYKEKLLANIELQEVFIRDYYGVLENTLLQIQSSEEFYNKYNLKDKHELLAVEFKLNESDDNLLSYKDFRKVSNRRILAKRRKEHIFIDEGQDCHRLEKDILIALFGSERLVVANGGKEQLIRHNEVCNWEVTQGKKIKFKKINTYNKSFRMKKASVDLCNYIAKHYNIDLNLVANESEDIGEVIIDLRKLDNPVKIENVFSKLESKGVLYGCKAYESLMVLVDSYAQSLLQSPGTNEIPVKEQAVINEYGSIQVKQSSKYNKWIFADHFRAKSDGKFVFWDGTVSDKRTLSIPTSLESRLIYYESCRGLESWSVACFALDEFFNHKRKEDEAEKFLLDDLFLSNNTELRRSMYAATWALMALTRVIDTLYIQVENPSSEIAKLLIEYAEKNKDSSNIIVLRD